MSQAAAATFIVAGIILMAWAVMMWVKRYRAEKAHSRWVTFLMTAAGAGLGAGAGYLAGVNVVREKIGYCPLWVPFVLIAGFGFILEVKGWRDHHARTPVLGFVTALVLFLAVGAQVVSAAGHEFGQVRTASYTVPGPQGRG